MRLLLDTHAILWFDAADDRLSSDARVLLADPSNTIYISPASYWEIAIKANLGKYQLLEDVSSLIGRQTKRNGFRILPLAPEHADLVAKLPFHHRDPFDRMLVAQAMVEQLPLVSSDEILDKYPITRLW